MKRKIKSSKCFQSRAYYKITAFIVIIGVHSFIKKFELNEENQIEEARIFRQLSIVNVTPELQEVNVIILVCLGILYMFVAIAIVCDEFFVPALEEIASESYLNLSMDVAGATLMAAGGSAPELFTSLIGTFQKSEVGFGTIVGSAVFNVLFVIGMCAIFSKDVLELTWWPLFRDCTYYAITLGALVIFCGVTSPNKIEIWEAAVLFSLYIVYVVFMKFNQNAHDFLMSSCRKSKTEAELSNRESLAQVKVRPNTFHAGLLNFFMGKGSVVEKVGIAMVTKIKGDVDTVFKTLDVSGDGYIDHDEFEKLVEMLNASGVEDHEIDQAIAELDENNDGKIDLKEFTKWYIKSELRLKAELKSTFEKYDVDNSGTIDGEEMKQLMKELGTEVSEVDVQATLAEAHIHGPLDQISFDEFQSWYTQSKYWNQRLSYVEECAEEATEPISNNLFPPKDGKWYDYISWLLLLPIVFILCVTIPDVRQPGKSRLCFVSFFLSMVWIGSFTYVMVSGAEIVGKAFEIPMVLMGLTILAAGTSVPDLLSSIIVSRMGEGDMAVSSSVGSNIFDITVGLPIPWLIFQLINPEETITIETKGMTRSIIILLVMLILVVTMIHLSGWKMTKSLGGGMFVLYIGYLIQAIVFHKM